MKTMSCVENLAAFVCRSAYEDLSETTREQLKVRILDSLGRCGRARG
jgi:2-methylcitrate dehydratase PrpD